MGKTNLDVLDARIEELLFAVEVLTEQENPKIILLNKIDDLLEVRKEVNKWTIQNILS